MDLNPLPTEIFLSHSRSRLSRLYLDGNPQPGEYVEVEGQAYLILERRNRYLLRTGKYKLAQIALYVQPSHASEKSLLNGQWAIGDVTCQFNPHSELLRCAVNPSGPCDRCLYYQPQHPSLGTGEP